MEFNQDIDLSIRKLTSRLIIQRALKRGWHVTGFKTNPGLYLLRIPGRTKPIQIFSAAPPTMSLAASKISKDKYITNQLLAMHQLPVPAELLIESQDTFDAHQVHSFIKAHGQVVVKPLDSAHGRGITVGITSVKEAEAAVKNANLVSEGSCLLQQQLSGIDVRILCINHKYVDAITRVPATVMGDGVMTTEQLITKANTNNHRGENYTTKLNKIPLELADQYLGKEKLSSIPPNGELVQVVGVANVGMGGERKNIKDSIPSFMIEWAEVVSRILELPVCGVDFMVKHLPHKDDKVEALMPVIIEVNNVPSLIHYDDLASPEQNRVIDYYLDYLAAIDKS